MKKKKKLWQEGIRLFFLPAGKRNALIPLAGIFTALNSLIQAVFPGLIIGTLYPEIHYRKSAALIAIFCISTFLVSWICEVLERMTGFTNLTVNETIREKLLKLQMRTGLQETESPQYADRIAFAGKCIDRSFYAKTSSLFVSLISIVLVGAGCIRVVGEKRIFLPFVFVSAALFPLVYFCKTKINGLRYVEVLQNNPVQREMETLQYDMLDLRYSQEVRCFALLDFLNEKYKECRRAITQLRLERCKKTAVWAILPAAVYGLQLFWAYLAATRLLSAGQIGVGGLVVYANALFTLASMAGDLADQAASVQAEGQYLEALLACIQEYEETCQTKERAKDSGGQKSAAAFHTIQFSHVSFSYSGDENYALKDLNLVIHAGEKISIVGENGSGKSTFIKLLLGLYTPTKGTVLIDGKDLREIPAAEAARFFAPVFQDYAVPAYPIKESVALLPDIDAARLRTSLKQADVLQKVDSLPKGADTYIFYRLSPEGTELSGGEMQKIAAARAYYKDAPVLVLDEPTAALSPQAEVDFYRRVWHESGNRTVFFISHRLSSCCESERILVFREGALTEEGSHRELMDRNGYYHQLFQTQAEHYH